MHLDELTLHIKKAVERIESDLNNLKQVCNQGYIKPGTISSFVSEVEEVVQYLKKVALTGDTTIETEDNLLSEYFVSKQQLITKLSKEMNEKRHSEINNFFPNAKYLTELFAKTILGESMTEKEKADYELVHNLNGAGRSCLHSYKQLL